MRTPISRRRAVARALPCALALTAAPAGAAEPARALAPAAARADEDAKKSASAGWKSGFVLETDDKDFRLKLGGYLQADARLFANDEEDSLAHQFVVRRARPVLDATVHRYFDVRLMPDFGGGKVLIQDAYLDMHFVPWLRLRAGKMKAPFGLERLQSATNLAFVERGLPTSLVPNRDVGAMLHGEVASGALTWAAGVFNGVADGGSGDGDTDDDKDVVGRVLVHPFRLGARKALHDIGFGVAGAYGQTHGEVGATGLAAIKTSGQATFASFTTGAAAADTALAWGARTRFSPQGYAYVGPVGLFGEYVRTATVVRKGGVDTDLKLSSFQLAATVLLTGERASYRSVTPDCPLGPEAGTGAFELAGRYGELRVGQGAFDAGLASPDRSAGRAKAWAAGVNWHLNRGVKVQLDFERTTFEGGKKDGDRDAENVVLSRLQIAI